jgi:MoaA/NifB/PqqE/SkfB family radical SAM enzyme
MDKEPVYTSTGIKLIHHPDVVQRVKNTKRARPISLQVALTSRCNLKCSFCSNANREQHEDLPIDKLQDLLIELSSLGLKTVEWTGGGEPLLYKQFEDVVRLASGLILQQGLITNGLLLPRVSNPMLRRLRWVRVSMNCLDYVDKVDIPTESINGVLGFSYVMNNNTTDESLAHLREHVKKYDPRYVRIVPNCQATNEEQEANNAKYARMVSEWGEPYFYQAKHFSTPPYCYWGYFKPFLLHNGWVYPCSSVVLNEDSEKTFHEKYQWVRMENLPSIYRVPMVGGVWGCTHCVFRPQNDLVANLLNPTGMEDFV